MRLRSAGLCSKIIGGIAHVEAAIRIGSVATVLTIGAGVYKAHLVSESFLLPVAELKAESMKD